MGELAGIGYRSTFLFGSPTWKEGVGRLVDFGDTLTEYNISPTPEAADFRALWMDWAAVGDDIRSALSAEKQQADRR